MRMIFFESESHTVAAALQRFQRLIMPILDECMENGCEKTISIDDKNNLCINGTPIGDWRKMCNFSRDGWNLVFHYGERIRIVSFGAIFEPPTYVSSIYEYDSNYKNLSCIWDKTGVDYC